MDADGIGRGHGAQIGTLDIGPRAGSPSDASAHTAAAQAASPPDGPERRRPAPLWPPPVARLIGFDVTEIDAGRAVVVLDAGPQHTNPMGTVHGGILCDVADAAMGVAYASTLGAGESFTTIELKINFLRPVFSGRLVATARVVKGGRTVGLVECDVVDAEDRLVARAGSTCMTLRGEQAAGR